jgi:hypothetical protein
MSKRRNVKRSSIAFGALAASAGVYELVAIVTDWFPTITELVLELPVVPRAALVLTAVVAIVDHFLTRRVL